MNPEEEKKLPPDAVIIDVRPKDFVAGGETGISAQPSLMASGQYDMLLPDEEVQYDFHFDTFACVSFSALNCLEIIFNAKLISSLFSEENKKWLRDNGYVDYRTGKINLSDRFIAKLSNTTNAGNSLGAVGDAIRNFGVVPEALWPWPAEMNAAMTDAEKWALYYKDVPQSVKNLGLEFRKRFEPTYQWILLNNPAVANDTLKQFLPKGPVQIASLVCSPWNSNDSQPPIEGCGCGAQHATTIYGYNDLVSIKDFDHYRSFRKLLAWNYCIPWGIQYYLNEIAQPPVAITKPKVPLTNLSLGMPASGEVRHLQECLQYFKFMKPGVFGPFGPQTQVALASFQVQYGITDKPQGAHFGPQTRAKMNQLLS